MIRLGDPTGEGLLPDFLRLVKSALLWAIATLVILCRHEVVHSRSRVGRRASLVTTKWADVSLLCEKEHDISGLTSAYFWVRAAVGCR